MRLALTHGCMANSSHAIRMDPFFGYPATKFVKRKSIFSDRPVSALNNSSDAVTNKTKIYIVLL